MSLPWRTAWTIARRDLSPRFRGLRLLLVSLLLGVGALAAIGSLTTAIERALTTRGASILGGDIEVEVWQRRLSEGERKVLSGLGTLSQGTRMQAMATSGTGTGAVSAPVTLKAVDARWPLEGRLRLADGRLVGAPLPGQAWIAEGAAQRLSVRRGDTITIGGTPMRVGGVIADDPEQLGEGFALGPSVIVPAEMPARSGLTAPGAMYRTKARVAINGNAEPDRVAEALKARFPDAGFTVRTRNKAAPGIDKFVESLGEFLSLVGLAALAIAGIGIAGGVSSYLEARRSGIATLKVLGATSGDIARIYLCQIAATALTGCAGGLIAGALAVPLLARALGGVLPVDPGLALAPLALARAGLFGLLVALVWASPPLIRARSIPAMALMRAHIAPVQTDWRRLAWPMGAGVACIVALAFAGSSSPGLTAWFLAGATGVLALLGGLGMAIRRLAAAAPRPANPLLRAALANLHRPAAPTLALVTALGFGLSAFVLLAAVGSSLDSNIARRVPLRAPDYFVLDVPEPRATEFAAQVQRLVPGARVRMVPALRGAILALGKAGRMTRVADMKDIGEKVWQLRGERGLTYSDDVPEGNVVTQGRWWPRDYHGPPLVSVDEKLAQAVGLRVGDQLTIALLGVERTATVASLRRIDWDSLGFNYVLVFSPNTLRDAPHNLAATIALPPATVPASKGELLRALVGAFPSSSVIETSATLRDARALLDQMARAIFAAASVAVLAGLAVLAGSIAAARAARTYDTVILRVLGATRRQILVQQVLEYGLLTAALAVVALALGSSVAWVIVVRLFEFDWLPAWGEVLGVLAAGCGLILAFALAGSLPLLRAKPAQALREL